MKKSCDSLYCEKPADECIMTQVLNKYQINVFWAMVNTIMSAYWKIPK